MASFDLTEEQRILCDEVHHLAQSLMREGDRHRHDEKAGAPSAELVGAFQEMQLALVEIPESLGGVGMGALGAVLVQEELAWGDAGAALAMPGPGLLASAVLALGSEAQQKRLLGPFVEEAGRRGALGFIEPDSVSDAAEFKTTWTRKGSAYVLDGAKALVLGGGIADATVIFAVEAGQPASWERLRAFVVHKDNPGMKASPRRSTLGLRAAVFADVRLERCEVAASDALERADPQAFSRMWAMAAAGACGRMVGLARAAVEESRRFCMDRVAFGKPIAQHQGMSWYLVDMMMEVEATRLSAWQSAYHCDQGEPDPSLAMRAQAVADRKAMAVCDHAIQALGGAGFIQDFPVEKWSRDARTHALIGGIAPVGSTMTGEALRRSTRPI